MVINILYEKNYVQWQYDDSCHDGDIQPSIVNRRALELQPIDQRFDEISGNDQKSCRTIKGNVMRHQCKGAKWSKNVRSKIQKYRAHGDCNIARGT